MPIIVSGSEGTTTISGSGTTSSGSAGSMTYGSGSISGSTGKNVVTGSFIVSGSAFITGTMYVTGNTIYNYGDFYNSEGIISGSSTLEMGGAVTFNNTLAVTGNVTMEGTSINDANGNELIGLWADASAINYARISNAAAGSSPHIAATGDDDHVSLSLGTKGNQSGLVVLNDSSVGALLLLCDGQSGGSLKQTGFKAPNAAANSYYIILPVSGASAQSGRDTLLQITSVSDTGGPTQLATSFEPVHGVYEPTGIKFKYTSAAAITMTSSLSLDSVGRIPIFSGSAVRTAELTGTLTFDFGLGPGAGPGGIQQGAAEEASAGYEIRYISGTSGHALIGTPETSSLTLPAGYPYSSDVLWFVYNDNSANLANFVSTRKTCWYGAYGPQLGDNAIPNTNFLVNAAANDTWTDFSMDAQVPANAEKVYLGFWFRYDGSSVWQLSLSGSVGEFSTYADGDNIVRIGSTDASEDHTSNNWKQTTVPMITGTLSYIYQRQYSTQTGYMWVMGWSY